MALNKGDRDKSNDFDKDDKKPGFFSFSIGGKPVGKQKSAAEIAKEKALKEEKARIKAEEEANDVYKFKSKNALTVVKKDTPVIVVNIEPRTKEIAFLSMIGTNTDTIKVSRLPYKSKAIDEEFFDKLTPVLEEFMRDKPAELNAVVYIVMPDNVVFSDSISIPTMKRVQMDAALDTALESMYKNKHELQTNFQIIYQNRKYGTYALTSVRKQILIDMFTTLTECKLYSKSATYTANATANAVLALRPKLRTANFLFIDIKEDYAEYVFVVKGKTVSFYSLPIGTKLLRSTRVVAENMLYSHDLAELIVLNAKEKAKAKTLTVMEVASEGGEGSEDAGSETPEAPTTEASADSAPAVKTLARKVPRKLPKFMVRDIPPTPELIAAENFRNFTKWALLLIKGNDKFTGTGQPDTVLVNMPDDLGYIIDIVNAEKAENKVEFKYFDPLSVKNQTITDNLELYGATVLETYNKAQNF